MQEEHNTYSSLSSSFSSRRISITSEEQESTIIVQRYKLCKTGSSKRNERSPVKKVGKSLINKKKEKRIKRLDGRWTDKEEELYRRFVLQMRFQHPTWSEKSSCRKRFNYFKEMSKVIKTRTAEQCRSHDQKMRKKYIRDDNKDADDTEIETETDEDEEDCEIKREFEAKMEEESPQLTRRSVRHRNAVNYKEPEDSEDNEEKKEKKEEMLVEKEQSTKIEAQQTEKGKSEIDNLLQAIGKISSIKSEVMSSGSGKGAKETSKEDVKEEETLKDDGDISMLAIAVGILRRRMIDLAGKMELEIV